MAVALLPYSPQHYDSLPPILEAGRNAEPSGAITALSSAIGHLFVKHDMHRDFGIILLHNHFELDKAEILVQFGNAANVLPSAWRFVDGGLAPYEFVYASTYHNNALQPIPVLTLEQHGSFVSELRAVLSERGLLDVLGLCLLDGKDIDQPAAVEIESGRSTITVDVDVNLTASDAFIHVIWQFGTKAGPSGEPVVFKKHKVSHKIRTDAEGGKYHADVHLTTKK